jgi:hypothetical protein
MNEAEVKIGRVYKPLARGLLRDKVVLCEGPRGTAKTRSELTIIMQRALAWPGSRWLLARSTRTRLSQSVLVTLEQQVFPSFGMAVPGGAGTANRVEYKLPNGSVLVPLGLDDQQRTQSAEFMGGLLAEAVEIPSMDDALALLGSMRQAPVWPDSFHQVFVDCNPGPPGHWVNQIAEPVPKHFRRVNSPADYRRLLEHATRPAPKGFWKRIVTRHQDNPGYFDMQRWDWTDLGRTYLDTLGHLRGHLRRRWLDGDWVAAEGTVYPEFDEDRHVINPSRVIEKWPMVVGWDPGYDHPTAILWFAPGPDGTLYIVDEIYEGGKGVAQHCASIHHRNPGRTVRSYWGDPQHAFSETAQSPESIATQARKCGISMQPWPRTGSDEEAMVEAVRELLRTDQLKVFRTCSNTIFEFQSWSYKRTAKGEVPPGQDKFEDANNHAMDVVKGIVATKPRYGAAGMIRALGAA